MTKEELDIIKTRFCAISPKKMQEIYATSGAAYKLVQAIPLLLAYISTLERSELSALPLSSDTPTNPSPQL